MSTMKNLKEKLTRENIRADLLRATRGRIVELWCFAILTVLCAGFIVAVVWMYAARLVPFFAVLCAMISFIVIYFLARKMLFPRQTRKNAKEGNFLVKKAVLDRCYTRNVKTLKSEGRGKNYCVLELSIFGECKMDPPLYAWSEAWNLSCVGLCHISSEGDEFYVVYTPDQPSMALKAYPAKCFTWEENETR